MSARVRVRARTCAYEIRLCKLSRTMMVAAVAAADHDPPYSPLPTNLFFLASLFTQDREKALGTRLFFWYKSTGVLSRDRVPFADWLLSLLTVFVILLKVVVDEMAVASLYFKMSVKRMEIKF